MLFPTIACMRASRVPLFVPVALALGLLTAGCAGQDLPDGLYATLSTSRGDIVIRLEYEKAPMTVANFVGLAEGKLGPTPGRRYYQSMKFHRVVEGFVIQTGDPTGTGTGGPGYVFPNEISADLKHDAAGVVAMANSGPDTNGSQFYITLAATPHLDGSYSVFGRVVSGMDVVDSIQQGDALRGVRITRVGPAATAFEVTKESFEAQIAESKERQTRERQAARERDLATIARRWPNATVTPSGLRYVILEPGSGPSPTADMTATCDYRGELLDGTVFDDSRARGSPGVFPIGRVIAGWGEALVTMKAGEHRILIIPPELGYGEKGYPGVIPPNSFLVFDVKLLSFQQ
jgi:cyclophilin family peptidyl-prolyl cis-trans isomerase